MQTCKHEFTPLDSQNVQCGRCEYVRHRIGSDDLAAHPVKQTIATDDLLEMLKMMPPTTTPNMPIDIKPYIHEWKPTVYSTGTNLDDNTTFKTGTSYTVPIKDITITYADTVV